MIRFSTVLRMIRDVWRSPPDYLGTNCGGLFLANQDNPILLAIFQGGPDADAQALRSLRWGERHSGAYDNEKAYYTGWVPIEGRLLETLQGLCERFG